QWWSVWYPGAEPGGGGYIAQRMLSAKDEKNAIWATLLFNFMHYAIRPWPWILVALASIVVFPNLDSLAAAFPNIDPSLIGNDLAYPAMMSFLPAGLLGLLVASLVAAFMSTISTHLNWGSSYVVHDFYHRFIDPQASDQKLVAVGRWTTVLLMIFSGIIALLLSNALQAFSILLQIGAGTGLLFILRWFWYRINVYSEITAMVVSFVIALYLQIIHPALGFAPVATIDQLLWGVGLTTLSWVLVTLWTPADDQQTLVAFYQKIQPGGPGWKKVLQRAAQEGVTVDTIKKPWDVPTGILCMLFGTAAVYCLLFAAGSLVYGDYGRMGILLALTVVSTAGLFYFWRRLKATAH
ncbi:MAG: Na+:solute symporter, partial [Flavobacteriaceae bacterium]